MAPIPRWYRTVEVTFGVVTGMAAVTFLALPVLVWFGVLPGSPSPSPGLWACLLLWGGFLLWLATQFFRRTLRNPGVRARADLGAGVMVMLSAGTLRAVGAPLGGYLGVLLLLGTFLLASGLWGLRRGRVPPPGRTD